jgi:hypothetical protein
MKKVKIFVRVLRVGRETGVLYASFSPTHIFAHKTAHSIAPDR